MKLSEIFIALVTLSVLMVAVSAVNVCDSCTDDYCRKVTCPDHQPRCYRLEYEVQLRNRKTKLSQSGCAHEDDCINPPQRYCSDAYENCKATCGSYNLRESWKLLLLSVILNYIVKHLIR